jgi:transposase
MTELPGLKRLTHPAKDELIHDLWDEVQRLREKVSKPTKTSKNSSLPPAQGFKPAVKPKEAAQSQREKESEATGGGRELSEQPDKMVKAVVTECQDCGHRIEQTGQRLLQRYDKIDIPPIRPIVTRVERYGCDCPACGKAQIGLVPALLSPGSPFSPRIAALVTTLRYGHAISYQRIAQLMATVFGFTISQGAIASLLRRVQAALVEPVGEILQRIRQAKRIGSDETSARVFGQNQWEWVFQNDDCCYHVIRPSRGQDVIQEVMDKHQPDVWVSDLFSAQKTHPAKTWQVCLAHQLRDCHYGIDAGDTVFSPVMKRILLRALAYHCRWSELSASTQYQYRCRIHRQLAIALALSPTQADGIRLQNRYRDLRDHLFLFLEDTTIPPTNNASEQALRMSVIFRKVTNGFRSDWGQDLFAQVRSVVNTGMRQGLSAFQAIEAALDPTQSLFPQG